MLFWLLLHWGGSLGHSLCVHAREHNFTSEAVINSGKSVQWALLNLSTVLAVWRENICWYINTCCLKSQVVGSMFCVHGNFPAVTTNNRWHEYFSFSFFYSGGLQDKKFDVDKRGMNLGDFNDIMRKGRSGFRPPNSKDMGNPDSGPYFEKVRRIFLVRLYCKNSLFAFHKVLNVQKTGRQECFCGLKSTSSWFS